MSALLSTPLLALLAILVPASGGLVVLTYRWKRRSSGLVVVGLVSLASLAITVLIARLAVLGIPEELVLFQLVPPLRVALRIDAMGALFAMTVAATCALALVHAVGYLPDDKRQWRFHGLLLVSLGSMIGLSLAANLITLLLFYELFSLLAYPLIVHERSAAAFRAGLKYLVYILSGGALVFSGIVWSSGWPAA